MRQLPLSGPLYGENCRHDSVSASFSLKRGIAKKKPQILRTFTVQAMLSLLESQVTNAASFSGGTCITSMLPAAIDMNTLAWPGPVLGSWKGSTEARRTLSELKQDAEIQGLVWFSHTVFNPI